MSEILLSQHRKQQTTLTTRRLQAALNGIGTETLRRHPDKSLPPWVSRSQLKTAVSGALDQAIAKLAWVDVEPDGVSDFVEQEINAVVSQLLASEPGDHIRQRRGHALHTGTRENGEIIAFDYDDDLDDKLLDYRDRIASEFDAMYQVARNKTEKKLLGLLQMGCDVGEIRKLTQLRTPDVMRVICDLRARVKWRQDAA